MRYAWVFRHEHALPSLGPQRVTCLLLQQAESSKRHCSRMLPDSHQFDGDRIPQIPQYLPQRLFQAARLHFRRKLEGFRSAQSLAVARGHAKLLRSYHPTAASDRLLGHPNRHRRDLFHHLRHHLLDHYHHLPQIQ